MSKLQWDQRGTRYYENGVSKGVLFPMADDGTYEAGVAWNGLINVTKSPEGAEPNDLWADNMKYASLRSAETFGGSIEAYTYPDEFSPCIGQVNPTTGTGVSATKVAGVYVGQQPHKSFGFCFRTETGNDTSSEIDDGYKLQIVYGATCTPSEESFDTINDSPDAITFSWDFDTTPEIVPGYKPMSTIVIDTRRLDATAKGYLAKLEGLLYGQDADNSASPAVSASDPMLPTPAQVIKLMSDGTMPS